MMIFSKLLYGPIGIAIFLIIMLDATLSAADHLQDNPVGLIAVVGLILVFTLLGTFGWRAVMRRGNARDVKLYFAVQSVIILTTFIVENVASGGGATVNLATPLLLQIGVLGWRTAVA